MSAHTSPGPAAGPAAGPRIAPGSPWDPRARAFAAAPLHGRRRVDVAIVGGGFSGLSAAYHLIREQPGRSIALVEAQHIGAGASGRNTGMAGPGVQGAIGALRRRHGDDAARAAFSSTLRAVDRVIELARAEKLDCELEVTGQLKVASTARQARSLERQARDFAALGLEIPYVGRSELGDALASERYRAALRYPGALLNPAKLCAELRRVVEQAGVQIFEHSRVLALRPGAPVDLELPGGALVADRVVLATNGYAPRLGVLRGQVWPFHTHLIQTEPLAAAQRRALGWSGREAIIESRQLFSYFRLTADDRIVFGGAPPCYRAADADRHAGRDVFELGRAYDVLRADLVRTFPALRDVAIARRWSGMMGFTIDRLPLVGWLERNVLFVGAWCGHGVALACASGATVADLLAGRVSRETALPWVRARAPRLPPDPLRSWGIRASVSALGWADRLGAALDRRGGRPGAGS